MKQILVVLTSAIITNTCIAAEPAGTFSLGSRATASLFRHAKNENPGLGLGGQVRLQFSPTLNTEWFNDYITSSIGDFARRNDYHFGWSMMFYPSAITNKESVLKPYLLAGHCFDYTEIKTTTLPLKKDGRWSMALQAGMGSHLNVTKDFDFSISGQYMLHLGKDIDAHKDGEGIEIIKSTSSSPEGHLLLTLSMNYKLGRLW